MIGEAAIVDMVVVAEEETIMVHLGVSRHRIGRQDVGFLVVNAVVVISTSRIKVRMQAAPVVAITIINILHILVLMAEVVVEVAFSDVQQSPQYPAGMALRFARVKRYRPDKTASQADTIESVRAILDRQLGSGGHD